MASTKGIQEVNILCNCIAKTGVSLCVGYPGPLLGPTPLNHIRPYTHLRVPVLGLLVVGQAHHLPRGVEADVDLETGVTRALPALPPAAERAVDVPHDGGVHDHAPRLLCPYTAEEEGRKEGYSEWWIGFARTWALWMSSPAPGLTPALRVTTDGRICLGP